MIIWGRGNHKEKEFGEVKKKVKTPMTRTRLPQIRKLLTGWANNCVSSSRTVQLMMVS